MVAKTSFLRKIQAPEITTDQCGKAKAFRLFSIQRPFMRSFHAAWFCFFSAFLSWFGIQPLIPTISRELGISKIEIAQSGIANVSADIFVRILVGPLIDRFGPRRVMATLLIMGSIPLSLSGLIKDGTGLIVLRLFIGMLGGTFVPCQMWTTSMFNIKVVGTANAIVGGWGNLGGGFTFIFMPGVFELIKVCGADEFLAWKIAVAVPAAICMTVGISIIFTTDDCPQGKWTDRVMASEYTPKSEVYTVPTQNGEKKLPSTTTVENGTKKEEEEKEEEDEEEYTVEEENTDLCCTCFSLPFWKYFTVIILWLQYGMCFGIEITVNNIMNLYLLYAFKKEGCVEGVGDDVIANITGAVNATDANTTTTMATTTVAAVADDLKCSILTQNTASLIASLFGLMNLFGRSLGGIGSDVTRKYFGLPGRLAIHSICIAMEGFMMIIFSQMQTIPTAIVALIFFSIFVQMSEGTTYALVPYTIQNHVGKVAGIVGSGGNAGAVLWNYIWTRNVETTPRNWFWVLGLVVLASSSLTMICVVQKFTIWSLWAERRKKIEQSKEIKKRHNSHTKL